MSCGDSTGPGQFQYPEVTVNVTISPHGSSECTVSFLATASNHADIVAYELYAPGTANSPTSSGSGSTPLGVDIIVGARDFFLDWNVTGPTYHYTAPSPHTGHC
jgi:hypothetical protein